MMVEVRAFSAEHIDLIAPRACHAQEAIRFVSTAAFTLFLGEEPLAVLGWFQPCSRVIQAWGILTDAVKKCPLAFHKTVKSLIEHTFQSLGIQRVQISVRRDYLEGQRWAESLGFQNEGLMRKYGPDQSDYYLFARVN